MHEQRTNDWADAMADTLVTGIKLGTFTKDVVAIYLRNIKVDGENQAFKTAAAALKKALEAPETGIAGGDK